MFPYKCKLIFQLPAERKGDTVMADVDYNADTWSGQLKYGNNLQGRAGTSLGGTYLQSGTPRLALGGADYGLCGALLHVGTTHAGHYEAEVKDLATGAWWTFNDDACGAVGADGSRRADGTSAYVLVYLREDVLDELAEDREDAVDMGQQSHSSLGDSMTS